MVWEKMTPFEAYLPLQKTQMTNFIYSDMTFKDNLKSDTK